MVTLLSLLNRGVGKKDALKGPRIKFIPVLFRHMSKGHTPKHFKRKRSMKAEFREVR